MKDRKRNIVLADCDVEEVRSMVETLVYNGQTFDIKSHPANWKRTGKISELKRYTKYFAVALFYFLQRKRYDVIVGWQQFYVLIYCFYCEMFSVKKNSFVVALNYTYKAKAGRLGKIYHWFMKKCLSRKYLDYIHVPSKNYADIVCRTFGFPRERILVMTFGVDDSYEQLMRLNPPQGFEKDGYALAIGRSNRDYDFLIRAWTNIDYPLVIISDTYSGVTDQKQITMLRNVAGDESYPWIANCGLMIVPIADGTICSGDTVLLTAMSLQRRIIVTVPSTLAEMYVQDGQNAVLAPKEILQFQNVVQQVLFSSKYKEMGYCAREQYLLRFTRRRMGEQISAVLNEHQI